MILSRSSPDVGGEMWGSQVAVLLEAFRNSDFFCFAVSSFQGVISFYGVKMAYHHQVCVLANGKRKEKMEVKQLLFKEVA